MAAIQLYYQERDPPQDILEINEFVGRETERLIKLDDIAPVLQALVSQPYYSSEYLAAIQEIENLLKEVKA